MLIHGGAGGVGHSASRRGKAQAYRVRSAGYMAQPNVREIGRLIDEGRVRPVIAATCPFGAAAQADLRQEEGHVHGKIVLDVAA